jgi:hypothetical protein
MPPTRTMAPEDVTIVSTNRSLQGFCQRPTDQDNAISEQQVQIGPNSMQDNAISEQQVQIDRSNRLKQSRVKAYVRNDDRGKLVPRPKKVAKAIATTATVVEPERRQEKGQPQPTRVATAGPARLRAMTNGADGRPPSPGGSGLQRPAAGGSAQRPGASRRSARVTGGRERLGGGAPRGRATNADEGAGSPRRPSTPANERAPPRGDPSKGSLDPAKGQADLASGSDHEPPEATMV